MSEKHLTPDDVAGRLDIPADTLRFWCTVFASRLSDGAAPTASVASETEQWVFTEEDVAVLSRVRILLDRTVSSAPERGRVVQ